MKVLVCGGRDYDDDVTAFEVLDKIHAETPITAIIHGCAQGADYIAGWWARKNNIPEIRYPAKWGEHGRAAGPIRNQEMLDKEHPDLVVAFPGGRGTDDMKKRALAAKVKLESIQDRGRDS